MTSEQSNGKKRFFKEDLEEAFEVGLDKNSSFLFGQGEDQENQDDKLPEFAEEADEQFEEFQMHIKSVVPEIIQSHITTMYQKFGREADSVLKGIDYYFEHLSATPRTSQITPIQVSGSPNTVSPNTLLSSPGAVKRRKKEYGPRLEKQLRPSVLWHKFIGSIQVNALATRPTAKPLKYGSELKIVKNSTGISSARIYNTNGKKKTSLANYIRLIDVAQNREVGRVPEDIAQILFPLVETDEVAFEATMIFCNNTRLSVGDTFIVQLDCFLTSVIFEKFSPTQSLSTKERSNFTQGVVENEDELQLRARKASLLNLFDKVRMKPILEDKEETDVPDAEVIDLEDDEVLHDIKPTQDGNQVFQATQFQDDALNLNQLKSFYKATQSSESINNLPETIPPKDVFKLELRRYQKQGLTWMLRREREFKKAVSAGELDNIDGDMMNPLWKQFKWPKDMSWAAQKIGRNSVYLDEQKNFYANLHTGEFSEEKPVIKSMIKGGLLADEMGLGKTISTLAMISMVPCDTDPVEEKNKRENEIGMNDYGYKNDKPYASKTTLIVVPMSLLFQWQKEFEKANNNPNAHCEIYYGGRAGNLITLLTKTKNPPTIILTSYGVIQSEWSKLPRCNNNRIEQGAAIGLFSVEFFRIVIDEGHSIRNRTTRTSKAVMDLSSSRKWVLTGTPIINRLDDLFSLVKFMKLEPWSQIGYWKSFVSGPFEKKNYKQAFDVVSSVLEPVLLRRTKQMKDIDGKPLVILPPKEIVIEKVKFNTSEDILYKFFLNKAENSVKESLARGDLLKKYSTILVHILRLRQVCCHIELLGSRDENDEDLSKNKMIQDKVDVSSVLSTGDPTENFSAEQLAQAITNVNEKYPDRDSFKGLECSICTSEPIEPITQVIFTECAHAFCEHCLLEYIDFQTQKKLELKCPNCRESIDPKRLLTLKERGGEVSVVHYDTSSKSSKICSLLKHLKQLQETCPGEQVVVFSQFSSYLDILENELTSSFSKADAKIYKFDGRLNLKDRSRVLDAFATKDLSKLKILLLSLRAGGVGLNLTCASRAYMMDPWWSPSLEDQAIDRVHRIGQESNVKIIRFIMENSIEEKMLSIQDRKRTLGEAVDADEEERRKRRIEEIQMLFE